MTVISPQEFQEEFGPEFTPDTTHGSPYGRNPQRPVKTGLTPRGKAAIAVVAVAIAGGSLLGYNHYAAQQATADQKARELALKQQELRLQELKILGDQAAANEKTKTVQDTARQKQIKACVDADKGLIGKQLGVTYSSILSDCASQFPASADVSMQAAANATDTTTGGSGGGLNTGVLIGAGVLAASLTFAVRKNTKSNPA